MAGIERILNNILLEATAVKFTPLKNACKEAIDLLGEVEKRQVPTHELRKKCLDCIQICLESRRTRFAAHGVNALQRMIADERFHSGIEPENEDLWLASQVLTAVKATPTFHENTQVEIMKVLLQLTLSHFWCASTTTIIKISEVCLDTYATCNQASIKAAIKATLTQMLSNLSEKLFSSQCDSSDDEPDAEDIVSDFVGKELPSSKADLTDDVVLILNFLCDRVSSTESQTANKPLIPLLLEGIRSVLKNLPISVRDNPDFVELLWKRLCPSLIVILGNPVTDKNVYQKPNIPGESELSGRGSGCSSSAPSLNVSSMTVLYQIVIELVKIVGCLRSLRPVLESVFHRMMLYPPPQHRLEALKLVREVLGSPEGVLSFAGPTINDVKDKSKHQDLAKLPQSNTALLKLVIDAVQECVHCNDVNVCIASVQCIDELLKSLEQICHGENLPDDTADDILDQFRDSDLPKLSPKHQARLSPRHQFFKSTSLSDDMINIDIVEQNGETGANEDEVTTKISLSSPSKARNTDSPTDSIEFGLLSEESQTQNEECNEKTENKSFDEVERQSAREYITCLQQVLPSLLDVLSVTDLDETLQTFASNFCAGQQVSRTDNKIVPILNADGVYLSTYNVLRLNLKLINVDYYGHEDKACPVTETMFIDEILDGELLLHLSDTWLKEVYHLVKKTNLLQHAGFSEQNHKNSVLYSVLVDFDGLESKQVSGQLMRSYQEETETDFDEKRTSEAGMKFVRYILALCWDGILDVLSVLLNGKSACGLKSSIHLMLGIEGAKEENFRARQAMCTSLEGLQRAATMSCLLGLHQRCATVFDQLAQASCVIEEYQHQNALDERRNKVVEVLSQKPKLPRLHAAHTMSLDVVVTTGLEIGSHARDCWPHVFRCCSHVSHFEHLYFSSGSSGPKTLKQEQLQNQQETTEDDLGSDLYGANLSVPVISLAPTVSVAELIKQSQKESGVGYNGVLNNSQTSKAICSLSQAVDRLFEDASDKLTMKALNDFLGELCQCSKQQLYQLQRIHSKEESSATIPTNVLLLYRLGDVMLRVIHSERPLMHIMKAWTVVAPHLIEAACHKDHRISKKAVICLHEVVTTLLSSHRELPHFHFNELLCKPFENLLCMELCDGDVQDQIVCSICELVEACTTEIRSGWRPLFASLRAVKIEFTASEEVNEARQRHVAAVLDVFDVFLNSDNVLVFSNAAVDCILCLLKYVRGPGAFEMDEDDSDDECDLGSTENSESLCIPALKYLQQCCKILARMWRMPACPTVNGAHRIRLLARPKIVDPIIPILDLNEYEQTFSPENSPVHKPKVTKNSVKYSEKEEHRDDELDETLEDNEVFEETDIVEEKSESNKEDDADERALSPIPDSLRISPDHEEEAGKMPNTDIAEFKANNQGLHSSIKLEHRPKTLAELDNHTGILHVWFLLLEGLANAVSASPRTYQPQTVETLFQLLRENAKEPGPEFGMYCINHLLLPMIQEWMRKSTRDYGYWRGQMNNFKQCIGLAADLVVEYVLQFVGFAESTHGVEVMLKQLLDVLVECISQPIESISRLGCSCFRHTLLSGGPMFTESLWHISTQSMLHAFRVSTYSLQQLMMLFKPNSTSFSGDLGGVKVAARKDCTMADNERLCVLALQVFLLDHQRLAGMSNLNDSEGDKSYIFLLYPPEHADSINPDHITARVPFRSMVVGLLSHQLLLQTVGAVLLDHEHAYTKPNEASLPGMLGYLSSRCTLTLLQCLQESYSLACQFDTRPGMKFLIQKVARSNVAANLYRQAGLSMTFLIQCLFRLATNQNKDIQDIRNILADHIQKMTREMELPYDISNNHRDVALARSSHESYSSHFDVYVKLLFEICLEVCDTYVDLVSDKEQTAQADKMSHQSLFFLVAEPEDLEIKKSKSFLDKPLDRTKDGVFVDSIHTTPVAVQADDGQIHSQSSLDHEPLSPTESEESHKHLNDKVYRVASDQTIKKLMSEYKKRKLHHAMPTFQKPVKPRLSSSSSLSDRNAIIEKEQNESIYKDAEAHIQSWTELTCTILDLLQKLDNDKFVVLLPVLFPSVNQLIRHAEDKRLRMALAEWVIRLGDLYHVTAKPKYLS